MLTAIADSKVSRDIKANAQWQTKDMPPVKYTDFEVSDPFTIRAKHSKDENNMREYVSIKCPHCQHHIGDILVDMLYKMKATKCKAHLEVCPEFRAKGSDVTPAPIRTGTSELLRQMADMRREMQQNHRESMARLSKAFGLGDPDAQTENELAVRGKRKFEEEAEFFKDIGILYSNKFFKRVIEMMKHDEKGNTDEERGAVERIREKINDATKRR